MAERREHVLPPVERRTFLRYSLFGATAGGLGVFGVGAIGFLWPRLGGGFGDKITLPVKAQDLFDQITNEKAPFEFPSGRMYIVAYDPTVTGAMEAYGEDHAILPNGQGLMALFQKCVHLGCRVPWCQTSQWFECPCHGSKYNKWGEWVGGPAPRGLDRFPSVIDADGNLVVDTGAKIAGPARTAKVLQQEAEGANCVDL